MLFNFDLCTLGRDVSSKLEQILISKNPWLLGFLCFLLTCSAWVSLWSANWRLTFKRKVKVRGILWLLPEKGVRSVLNLVLMLFVLCNATQCFSILSLSLFFHHFDVRADLNQRQVGSQQKKDDRYGRKDDWERYRYFVCPCAILLWQCWIESQSDEARYYDLEVTLQTKSDPGCRDAWPCES